jgi:ubiquinone/menaquinone biosynthesis C-methylase UbiE
MLKPTAQTSANPSAISNASPVVDPWEAAYSRFETPAQEVHKFVSRLKELGARSWPKDAAVVELFCGRGNGLHALQQLGFSRVAGLDLSPRLLAQYNGPAQCIVGDCRHLPFADHCKDVIIVQGGLHHLPELPNDLDQTLSEIRRVLKINGRAMFVEPWSTPFLNLVHAVCENPLARRCSVKLDALATMIHYERRTYEQWLSQPQLILSVVEKYFAPVRQSFRWGKWRFLGTPRG